MVYTGATEERRRSTVAGKSSSSAAMNSERGAAKPLHNFNFAWDLKWGSQRHLRCMKVESDADNGGDAFDHHRRSRLESSSSRRRESEFGGARRRQQQQQPRIGVEAGDDDEEEGIDAVREKLMNEFKTAADKMKDAIFRGGEERPQQQQQPAAAVDAVMTEAAAAEEDEEEEVEEEEEGHVVEGGSSAAAGSPSAAAAAAALRPWNLRTRRAACKAPPPISKGLRIEEKKAAYSPLRNDGGGGGTSNVGAKSPRLMRGASGSGQPEKERPKFSLTLSKKEIEEDFIKMLGHRPPRRPKRRPRAVQRQLDSLFPGSWLTEVSADSYKVPEFPENVKR